MRIYVHAVERKHSCVMVSERDWRRSSRFCVWANSGELRLSGDYRGKTSSTRDRLTKFPLWWRSAPQSPKYPDEKVAGTSWYGSVFDRGETGWLVPRRFYFLMSAFAHILLSGFKWSSNWGVVSSFIYPLMALLSFLFLMNVMCRR